MGRALVKRDQFDLSPHGIVHTPNRRDIYT
jgi:hypothetical protein